MIICPVCGNHMVYRVGENNGRHFEFYGCSTYPHCRKIVEIKDSNKCDDGIEYQSPERTLEEEGEGVRDMLLREGFSWEEAAYARHMWEKD